MKRSTATHHFSYNREHGYHRHRHLIYNNNKIGTNVTINFWGTSALRF